MIPGDITHQLQLLIKAVAPPLIEVAETPLEAPQWLPGQKLQAVVLASLPNGRFQVMVSEHQLDMNLPRNTQPGDTLELTFVSAQPRPTFVLTQDLSSLQPKPSANNEASLSGAARFLGALLNQETSAAPSRAAMPPIQTSAAQTPTAEGGAVVTRTAPLIPAAPLTPADVPELARQLGRALTQSGLFYEAHQAQWVAGQRPLNELLQEPQGQLSPRLAPAPGMPQAVAPNLPAAEPQVQRSAPSGLAAGAPASERMAAPEPVHPQTTGLVQQQLAVLDNRQVLWQGQVWPGQTMEWRVEEREARTADGSGADTKEWHTRLRLHMPHLGTVDAALNLTAQGLQLQLRADRPAALESMRGLQGELLQSLQAAGLKMLGLAVENTHGG